MKYNEIVERHAPRLGRKNLANGLSCPSFVYMENSSDGMWVHYVTYCENIRKLKRALWLARADRADDRARIFYFNDLETMLDIDGYSYDSKKKKGCKKFTARLWRIIWLKVERKCRAKAEEYK